MVRRLLLILSRRPAPGRARLTGRATVLDGDTIEVADRRIRLHGLDAPELGQDFAYRGRRYDAGAMALAALEALVAGVELRCEIVEPDRHGRFVAKVFSRSGVDVCHRMVLSGWALAYRHYSHDYVAAERTARRARRGLWRGTFTEPWTHRRTMAARQAAATRVARAGGVEA